MIKLHGAIRSPRDSRDWPVAMVMPPEPITLPLAYRLTATSTMPGVYEQVGPTCVTSSSCGVAEFHERAESGSSTVLNDDQMYARCKQLDGYPGDGTYPRTALEVWRTEGIYTDNGKGPDHFKIAAYYAVGTRATDIAQVIYEKKQPVLVAMNWPSTWYNVPANGVTPKIIPNSYGGGHQIWAWGFDFTQSYRGILFRNSWGKAWGLNGNFWGGYEMWTISGLVWEAWFAESRP